MQAQAAEFSGYVSESSSFCLFTLPPHQDRRQKLELSLTWFNRNSEIWNRLVVGALVIEKAVIDRTNRMIPLACKEVEDENDDEDDSSNSEFRFNGRSC